MRKLQSLLLACALAAGTMPTTACNSQTVLTELEKFAPVATNLLVVACEFTSSPLCSTGGALVSDAEKHVFTLWQAYLDAQSKGAATSALWNDLNSALDVLISHSSDVFSLAHVVNGPHQQEVLAMATATETLLAVIESLLPANPAPVKAMAVVRPARLGTFLPKLPASGKYDAGWFKQWKKDYNALPVVQSHKMQIKTGLLGAWIWSTPRDSTSGLATGHQQTFNFNRAEHAVAVREIAQVLPKRDVATGDCNDGSRCGGDTICCCDSGGYNCHCEAPKNCYTKVK